MRWIRIQGAVVVVMLATIHQVRHSVLHGTLVAKLGKRCDVYHCNAGPQKLISVDVFVLDGLSVSYRGRSDKLYPAHSPI